ncbi:hypothetical protein JT359_19935, partial [Candidatus Poribacteria bacterium]|nr:hypothetical protein [Candidatus Poribacteria bacterium]
MREYARLISLAGGILAFYCFTLPWVDTNSGVEIVIEESHLVLVILIAFFTLIGFGIYAFRSNSIVLGIVLIGSGLFFSLILTLIFYEIKRPFGHDDISFVISLAFFASLAIIGSSLLLNRQGHWHAASKVFVLTNAVLGLICFMIVVFSSKFDLEITDSRTFEIKYGA